jgi:7-cyano-7-deazaguanine synthase in queuosine biosynthesis
MSKTTTDYSKYLVLYSGGADSTYFIEREPTARHLIHYTGMNEQQTKLAVINANILNRYIVLNPRVLEEPPDGETNQIHALFDTKMAIDAGIKALSFGMSGIVMCFNADDLGIDVESVVKIFRRTDPSFELLTPLISMPAKQIRKELEAAKGGLKYVSCMFGMDCGFCAKCKRGY